VEISFEYNRPSITTIRAAVRKAMRQGHKEITVTWGENQIRLEKQTQWIGDRGPWTGDGWIRQYGGDDMAQMFNKENHHAHD
jgi:hypothetical protein